MPKGSAQGLGAEVGADRGTSVEGSPRAMRESSRNLQLRPIKPYSRLSPRLHYYRLQQQHLLSERSDSVLLDLDSSSFCDRTIVLQKLFNNVIKAIPKGTKLEFYMDNLHFFSFKIYTPAYYLVSTYHFWWLEIAETLKLE